MSGGESRNRCEGSDWRLSLSLNNINFNAALSTQIKYPRVERNETMTTFSSKTRASNDISATSCLVNKALSCFLRHVALGEMRSTYDLTKKITEYGRATNKAFVEGLTTYCIMALRATGNVYNILKEHSDDGVPYGCAEGSVDTSMRGRYQDQEGLAFHESYDADETSRKLDYVITQVDICRLERMEKHACGSLGVSCIDDIPSHVFQSKSNDLSLILESDGDDDDSEDVSEFLKRNEHIIDDYSTKLRDELEFSWMVVPECPEEGDDLTRLSQESSSHAEAQAASDDEDTAKTDICDDFCFVCGIKFIDGECVRILPCKRAFHSRCTDRLIEEESSRIN